jgi:hypothetical protein
MRAICIRQPWAHFIVKGFKDIENRSWKTNYRGPILIHAGETEFYPMPGKLSIWESGLEFVE